MLKDTRRIQILASVNVICQYLDHKNCVCKNKLVGRLISECTSVINETMMNNNDNNNDNNIYRIMAYVFIGLFLLAIICFCVFAYFKWFKDKNYLKINILIIKMYNI